MSVLFMICMTLVLCGSRPTLFSPAPPLIWLMAHRHEISSCRYGMNSLYAAKSEAGSLVEAERIIAPNPNLSQICLAANRQMSRVGLKNAAGPCQRPIVIGQMIW
jgi:hypothetical protein